MWGEQAAKIVDRRWWWEYETPPLRVVQDQASGDIVGMCATIPFSLSVRGVTQPAAWFVDFFVAPSRRGQGIGKILTAAVNDEWPVTASLSQTDPAWHTFQRLGWSERRFIKVFASLLPMVPGTSSLFRRSAARRAKRLELMATERALTAEAIDGSFDQLWARVRPGVVATVRDGATLRARFAERAGPEYRLLSWHRGDVLVGYAVVCTYPRGAVRALRRLPVGVIVDFLLDPTQGELFTLMVDAAMATATAAGARCVLCQTSVPAFERVLARRGFLHAGLPLVGRRLSSLNAGFTYKSVSTLEPEGAHWFLTFADCDVELTWRSRA